MGILVICSYKAKAGQEAEVRTLMQEHLPMLQRLGLATARPGTMMEGKDGVFVEVFEWASEAASRFPDGACRRTLGSPCRLNMASDVSRMRWRVLGAAI